MCVPRRPTPVFTPVVHLFFCALAFRFRAPHRCRYRRVVCHLSLSVSTPMSRFASTAPRHIARASCFSYFRVLPPRYVRPPILSLGACSPGRRLGLFYHGSCIFCCCPIGLFAIYKAWSVRQKWERSDFDVREQVNGVSVGMWCFCAWLHACVRAYLVARWRYDEGEGGVFVVDVSFSFYEGWSTKHAPARPACPGRLMQGITFGNKAGKPPPVERNSEC